MKLILAFMMVCFAVGAAELTERQKTLANALGGKWSPIVIPGPDGVTVKRNVVYSFTPDTITIESPTETVTYEIKRLLPTQGTAMRIGFQFAKLQSMQHGMNGSIEFGKDNKVIELVIRRETVILERKQDDPEAAKAILASFEKYYSEAGR